jgi:hypothetical protein
MPRQSERPNRRRPSRGRGRGRGEEVGEASATCSNTMPLTAPRIDTPPPLSAPPALQQQEDISQSATPLTFSTPPALQEQQNVSQSASPTDSPAPAPTETPAPTPARAPVQRLDSLSAAGRGGLSTGGGVGGRVMSGKFKPKAVRRGFEERQRAEQEEKERREQRELQAWKDEGSSVTTFTGRGTERGDSGRGRGRGRGDAMGRGGLDRNTRTVREATGLFGVAPAAAGKFSPINI